MSIEGRQIVFLGPSLNKVSAKALAPRAIFLPPIRCGDILHALKLKPAAILIVDGYFERIPSVWHKEILYALAQGIHVYGAASMGALRAAELCHYGMIGIGEIFSSYQQQVLEDDDEVAVLHAAASEDYQVLTDALVNIRATLTHALKHGIITLSAATAVLTTAQNTHYKMRFFTKICTHSGLPDPQLQNLLHFIKQGGYINLKAKDTQLALQMLQKPMPTTHQPSTIDMPKTLYFRALQHFITAKAFPYDAEALTMAEKLEVYSRLLLHKQYRLCFKIAMLMHIVYRIGQACRITAEIDLTETNEGLMASLQFQDYLKKLALIKATMAEAGEHISLHDLRIFSSLNKEDPTEQLHALNLAAQLYSAVIEHTEQLQLKPNPIMVLKYINAFRREKNLLTSAELKIWLEQQQLDLETFVQKLTYFALIDFCAFGNNSDLLVLPYEQDCSNWYLYALHMTGLSKKLAPLLDDQNTLQTLLQESTQALNVKDRAYLNNLDFIDLSDFDSFMHTHCNSN